MYVFFFFNDTATTEIYTLSLHDALPISTDRRAVANPAKEDVTRRLHQPLALDNTLAVVRERAPREERFQNRALRLLDLKEERVLAVAPEQQHYPAPRADTADADDLPREIHVAVRLEKLATIALQRSAVPPHQLTDLRLELAGIINAD